MTTEKETKSGKEWLLRVVLPGLIAHVHDRAEGRWWGFLIRTDDVQGFSIHDPRMIFERRFLAEDQGRISPPNAADLPGQPGAQMITWNLEGYDLWFEPTSGGEISPPLSPVQTSDDEAVPPKHGVLQSLRHLADFTAIHPEASRVTEGCFDPDPRPANVVSRIRLDRGALGTWAFEETASDPVVEWTFRAVDALDGEGVLTQYCAVALVCEMKVRGGGVIFKGMRFGTSDERGFVIEAGDGETVTINSKNCPRYSETIDIENGLQVDKDFLLYYRVASAEADQRRFVPTRPDEPGTPRGNTCCVCAIFAPRG